MIIWSSKDNRTLHTQGSYRSSASWTDSNMQGKFSEIPPRNVAFMWCHYWRWIVVSSQTDRLKDIKQAMGRYRRSSAYCRSRKSVRTKNVIINLFQIDWTYVDPSRRTSPDCRSSLLHRSVFTTSYRRNPMPKTLLWRSWHQNSLWQRQTTRAQRCDWLSWIRRPNNNGTPG